MNNHQRQDFYEDIEQKISYLNEADLIKLQYARNLTDELQQVFNAGDCDRIQIGPIDKKILEYFIFILLVEYESTMEDMILRTMTNADDH